MFDRIKGGEVVQSRPSLVALCKGFIGGCLGILLLLLLAQWYGVLLIMAPFGATCVLLFAVPQAPLAQPRSVIGGHFVCALIGLLMLNFVGDHMLFIALAVGLSIACMQILQVVHAPAGANPILIMMTGIDHYDFLLTPVLLGSVLLVLVALVVNNIGVGARWPAYWVGYHSRRSKLTK